MKRLLEKELELIKPPLKNHIASALENNFETSAGGYISKVLGVHIGAIDVDVQNSNFRNEIVINDIQIKARVKVDNSQSKNVDTIRLKLNTDIHLLYQKNLSEYKVIGGYYKLLANEEY